MGVSAPSLHIDSMTVGYGLVANEASYKQIAGGELGVFGGEVSPLLPHWIEPWLPMYYLPPALWLVASIMVHIGIGCIFIFNILIKMSKAENTSLFV